MFIISGQLLHVPTTVSPTTALMPEGPTPALMAAPPPLGGLGALAGVPRKTESAAMDQLRPLTGTSPLLPALMEANPSKNSKIYCNEGRPLKVWDWDCLVEKKMRSSLNKYKESNFVFLGAPRMIVRACY